MYVGVAITVGRDLDGNLVNTNSSDLPVNLYVGNLGAHRFVGMEGTPLPVRAAPDDHSFLFLTKKNCLPSVFLPLVLPNYLFILV